MSQRQNIMIVEKYFPYRGLEIFGTSFREHIMPAVEFFRPIMAAKAFTGNATIHFTDYSSRAVTFKFEG